jgi:hypothetical protein
MRDVNREKATTGTGTENRGLSTGRPCLEERAVALSQPGKVLFVGRLVDEGDDGLGDGDVGFALGGGASEAVFGVSIREKAGETMTDSLDPSRTGTR